MILGLELKAIENHVSLSSVSDGRIHDVGRITHTACPRVYEK
jgi:hypothetical protein